MFSWTRGLRKLREKDALGNRYDFERTYKVFIPHALFL